MQTHTHTKKALFLGDKAVPVSGVRDVAIESIEE